MLPPWFKMLSKGELQVLIQPQRIVLLHLARPLKHGFKLQFVNKQTIELPYNFTADVSQQKVNLQTLRQHLANEQWWGLTASLVLTSHFVRHVVIPWNAELISRNERQAFMLHCFTQSYGESAKSWDLCVSTPSFGKNAIASAISQSLLQELHTIFAECGFQLVTVYPHLMLAINQTLVELKYHHKIARFWLVAVLAGQICLVLYESDQWCAIKNVTLEVDVSNQVGALIQREMINNNIQEDLPKFLYWPESHYTQPINLAGFEMIKVMPHLIDSQHNATLHQTSSLATV